MENVLGVAKNATVSYEDMPNQLSFKGKKWRLEIYPEQVKNF
jgi:hypothetical protein